MAVFLFMMVFLPAHTARDILINVWISIPFAIVFLQLIFDKNHMAQEKDPNAIKPIFWGKLLAFQEIRWSTKFIIVIAAFVVPLLIINLFKL